MSVPSDELLSASPGPIIRLKLRLDVRRIMARIDRSSFQAIRERYRLTNPSAFESKYWSLERQLSKNTRRAYRLRLRRLRPPREILDLGTGFGYFPFVCGYYGHRAMGLDLDDWAGTNLYRDVVELLGVERVLVPIRACRPLPDLGRKFDLITAFACLFNRLKESDVWSVGEWEFFVEDLVKRHLNPGGSLMMTLNRGNDGETLDASSRRWFVARGACIEGTTIHLRSSDGPR